MMRNPVPISYRDRHGYEEEEDAEEEEEPNDIISISHRSWVSLNGYTWKFRVHENA